MTNKKIVIEWLKAGAEVNRGIQLFSDLCPENKGFPAIVEKAPDRYKRILIEKLKKHFGITETFEVPRRQAPPIRDQYPFLSSTNCPNEIKILVSDKITSYGNYCDAHDDLYNCIDLQSCYLTAKRLIENYKNNRAITAELNYYRQHGTPLGLHPVFQQMDDLRKLKAMPLHRLIAEKKKLENNLWRVESEMKKGDKRHLLTIREERRKDIRRKLDEINRIIESYE